MKLFVIIWIALSILTCNSKTAKGQNTKVEGKDSLLISKAFQTLEQELKANQEKEPLVYTAILFYANPENFSYAILLLNNAQEVRGKSISEYIREKQKNKAKEKAIIADIKEIALQNIKLAITEINKSVDDLAAQIDNDLIGSVYDINADFKVRTEVHDTYTAYFDLITDNNIALTSIKDSLFIFDVGITKIHYDETSCKIAKKIFYKVYNESIVEKGIKIKGIQGKYIPYCDLSIDSINQELKEVQAGNKHIKDIFKNTLVGNVAYELGYFDTADFEGIKGDNDIYEYIISITYFKK